MDQSTVPPADDTATDDVAREEKPEKEEEGAMTGKEQIPEESAEQMPAAGAPSANPDEESKPENPAE